MDMSYGYAVTRVDSRVVSTLRVTMIRFIAETSGAKCSFGDGANFSTVVFDADGPRDLDGILPVLHAEQYQTYAEAEMRHDEIVEQIKAGVFKGNGKQV